MALDTASHSGCHRAATSAMHDRTLIVEPEADAARLDTFLAARLPELSRRLLRRIIAERGVRVNGLPGAKGTRLRTGDRVTLPDLPAALAPEPALALPVVHEDDSIAVIDKPGGMRGHALDPRQEGTAAAFVLARWPETRAVGDRLAPGLVHRLDTGTSGLLLVARTSEAHAALRAALRARTIEKHYLALVDGDATELHGQTIAAPLMHDVGDRRRMALAAAGARTWEAATDVEVLAASATRTLVRAHMRTGVTHQVRVHLALLGHPVLGDPLYGGPPAALPPSRHALHAAELRLSHPADGRPLHLQAPLPPDLSALVP
jgi:23S rRNA pseudouridine1911/1915/1917 synthase